MGSRRSNFKPNLLSKIFGNTTRASFRKTTGGVEERTYRYLAARDTPLAFKEVKRKSAELLNALTKEDFQHCFDQWKNEWNGVGQGEYEKHSIVVIFKIKLFFRSSLVV